MKLVHEKCLKVDEIVQDLEKCYLESCKHNKKKKNDLDYFRTYMFVNLSVLVRRIQNLENK